jgi:Protein of unknown function (DUF1570)
MPASARAQELRVFQTVHYVIHTDLDEDLIADLGKRMDGMYDEYTRRLADFPRPDDTVPFQVYLVHTQARYLHFAGLAVAGTGGSFNPTRRLLAAFLDGQGRDALRRTLQHEAFHQFAADAIGRNLPVWLNEGLAQVFEEGIWTGNGFILGQVPPRRVRQLRMDIAEGNLIGFREFLTMPAARWAANWRDPIKSYRQYNQAWAMTHFLIYSTDEKGRPRYRARLIDMLKLLRGGLDGESAFAAAFSPNIDGFHDRFIEYARTLEATPLASLIENQGVLADMLASLKQRGRSFDTLEQFRDSCIANQWRIHYRRGNTQWESAADPSVYFTDPTGQPFTSDQERFELSGGQPLPDLICHGNGLAPLRTRFTENDGKIEHETLVDSDDDP